MQSEVKATKAALEAAIEAYRAAYIKANPDSTDGVLVDWIVISAETKPDMTDAEEDVTAYSIIMRDGSPWYRAMGLLQAGRHYLTHNTGPQLDDDA
jgi:hypothetical protein